MKCEVLHFIKCEGCEELHTKSLWWDDVCETFTCPICNKKYIVDGDSSYDEETDDEYSWFWLREVL